MHYHSEKLPETTEAWQELTGMGARKFGKIPTEWMTRLIFSISPNQNWLTLKDALLALGRRAKSARDEELTIMQKPAKGIHGNYKLLASGNIKKSYHILIRGLNPIQASCDCKDFTSSGLGMCKHVYAVVENVTANTPKKDWDKLLKGTPKNHTNKIYYALKVPVGCLL